MTHPSFQHLAARVFNTPLLIEPGYARVFFNALSSRLGIQNIYDSNGRVEGVDKLRVKMSTGGAEDSDRRRFYSVQDGIAVLPVSGTLVHKHGYMQPYSGMTGYDGIIARLRGAANDASVKGVLLDMDTPGGEVAGCFDATNQIRKLAEESGKPVWALCYDMNASAGMALASAAQHRLITQTGVAGSVGVVTAHVDWSAFLEGEGIDVTLIYSGAHKVDGNPYEALPEEVLADFQSRIDKLRGEFGELVSRMTGLGLDHVLGTEALCYRGQEAIDIGFADELVNGNEAIAVMAEYTKTHSRVTIQTGGMTMDKNAKTDQEKGAATTAPEQGAVAAGANQVDDNSSTDSGGEQNQAIAGNEPVPALAQEADSKHAERERISAIMSHEAAEGRQQLASHLAFKTDMSVEDAIAALEAAGTEHSAADSAGALAAAMSAEKAPTVGADMPAGEAGDGSSAEVSRIMGNYAKATGAKLKARA